MKVSLQTHDELYPEKYTRGFYIGSKERKGKDFSSKKGSV